MFSYYLFCVTLFFPPSFSTLCLLLVISLSRSVDSGNRLCSHVFLDMHYWLEKKNGKQQGRSTFLYLLFCFKIRGDKFKAGADSNDHPFPKKGKPYSRMQKHLPSLLVKFILIFLYLKWIFLNLFIQTVFSEKKNITKGNYP